MVNLSSKNWLLVFNYSTMLLYIILSKPFDTHLYGNRCIICEGLIIPWLKNWWYYSCLVAVKAYSFFERGVGNRVSSFLFFVRGWAEILSPPGPVSFSFLITQMISSGLSQDIDKVWFALSRIVWQWFSDIAVVFESKQIFFIDNQDACTWCNHKFGTTK